ncbi:uncharacterized protein LOC128278447 [Anopheles cruzii]|uniref:uncharacterized protein LOC128278447 n=1 Tax=Anopheles cruzii TaxID=68878 RepID=UPI0022EC3F58|nr:uncharacterized protein LOC128278447 [Anopheles cruzii]
MHSIAWVVALFLVTLRDAHSVYITRLAVPRVYVLDNYHHHHQRHQHQHHHHYLPRTRDDPDVPFDPEPDPVPVSGSLAEEEEPVARGPVEHLVLDCEYVIEPNETGFVLKWLHNDVPIYQWIPPHRSPSSLNRMRDHVNRTFTMGNEAMHKHRALALMQPTQDFAGKYSCSVQTFQSGNIKSADLFIIVPESGFVLKYYRSLSGDLVTVLCSVYGIFPAPEMSLWVNDYRLENGSVTEIPVADGLFDSSVSVQLVLYESLQADDVIKCVLSIPGTDYRRAKETVFVDVSSASRPFEESNSILEPSGVGLLSGMTTTSTTSRPFLSSTESSTPRTTTTTTVVSSTKVATTGHGAVVVGESRGSIRQPPAVPSVPIRLRPTATSTRVLTVQQANPAGAGLDPDDADIMNVLDFKEIFNENQLYKSGAPGLQHHRRFVVWTVGAPSALLLLALLRDRMLRT